MKQRLDRQRTELAERQELLLKSRAHISTLQRELDNVKNSTNQNGDDDNDNNDDNDENRNRLANVESKLHAATTETERLKSELLDTRAQLSTTQARLVDASTKLATAAAASNNNNNSAVRKKNGFFFEFLKLFAKKIGCRTKDYRFDISLRMRRSQSCISKMNNRRLPFFFLKKLNVFFHEKLREQHDSKASLLNDALASLEAGINQYSSIHQFTISILTNQ